MSLTQNKHVFSDSSHRPNKVSFFFFRYVKSHSFLVLHSYASIGAVRTATKRAGGTVHNHGGSPGKRLGVKKFSGSQLLPHNGF